MANPRNGKWYTVMAAVVAVLLAVAAYAFWHGGGDRRPLAQPPETVMQPFAALFSGIDVLDPPQPPEFDMKLMDLSDRAVPWDRFEGRVTFVNFWALWCPPCLRELPSLKALADEGIPGLAVAYISMDFPEGGAQLADVMKLKKVPGIDTYYINDLNAWENVDLKALPTTIVVDRRGRIAYRLKGDIDWQRPEARAFIDAILK